jgi:hypothetical protein
MGLADIAAGIEVVDRQHERGVATADDTDEPLRDRFARAAESLPCTPAAAATVVEAYADGAAVGELAGMAGVAPVTAAKALHRCGIDGLTPLTPLARDALRDWLTGDLPRSEALALSGATEAEFALATYIETHDPVPALVEATDAARSLGGNAAVEKCDALAETMDGPDRR